jgi:hypothetical protein
MVSGVPNTTQTTQETDINYGPFKSAYRINLDIITRARKNKDLSTSFPTHYCVLFVFGGVDPVSGEVAPRNAFEEGFSQEQCLKAWAKVGAAPLTRACLQDPKVSRTLGDSDDEFQLKLKLIQDLNRESVAALIAKGWAGHHLEGFLKPMKSVRPVSQPHSKERLELLAKASKAGQRFHATGGDHACSDDIFLAQALRDRRDQKEKLLKVKAHRQNMEHLQLKCISILMGLEDPDRRVKAAELKMLLKWQKLEIKKSKAENKATWDSFYADYDDWESLPEVEKWTAADEHKLETIDDVGSLQLTDTMLQRVEDQKKLDLKMAAAKMTEEEKAEILDIFASSSNAVAGASTSVAAAESSAVLAASSAADAVVENNSGAIEAEAASITIPTVPPVE